MELKLLNLPMVAQTFDYTCGAACFDSMFRFFKQDSPGELHFAKELGVLDLGYTPPQNIMKLAQKYGFICEMKEAAKIDNLLESVSRGEVVFITWWYEDSGHYSLVKSLDKSTITLMDPWTARDGLEHTLPVEALIIKWKMRGSIMISCKLQATK